MRHHSDRIRRIQELCAQLDSTIRDAHDVQHTVEQLQAESARLLDDLRPAEGAADHPARKSSEPSRRTKTDS